VINYRGELRRYRASCYDSVTVICNPVMLYNVIYPVMFRLPLHPMLSSEADTTTSSYIAISTCHLHVSPYHLTCCFPPQVAAGVSQDPVSDGFAALNEQSQVHPPFKIEINYGKTDKGHKDDRDYGGKAKLVASTRFTSRLRVETSFDEEDDMHCEGKYEAEDIGRECYKNRSTEYDRTQRDQRAGQTHTHCCCRYCSG
jgi:hypothetical protein